MSGRDGSAVQMGPGGQSVASPIEPPREMDGVCKKDPLDETDRRHIDESRLAVYRFYAALFLNPVSVPGHEFVDDIRTLASQVLFASDSNTEAHACFERFLAESQHNKPAIQQCIAIDRSMLLRATRQSDGPFPPRESLYRRDRPEREIVQELNVFYTRFKSGLSEGVHESPDYIGIECAFMGELVSAALDAKGNSDETDFWLRSQHEFLERHLGVWIPDCCGQLARFAETDAMKGLLLTFRDFIEQETML